MHRPVLYIDNLSKSFNGLQLFDKVDLMLESATINALFGANGSGKTTFFNLIGGYEKPNSGKIHFNGLVIKYHNEFEIAKAGIGKMWQNPTIFPNHTVLQNLLVSDKNHPGEYFLNYLFNNSAIHMKEKELRDKANHILQKLKLGNKSEQIAGSLSLGEKKLLSISMLLMNDAQLFLLDEPFSNVNLDTIERISEALIELKSEGKTIFMIEHKIRSAEEICDNIFKIENFKIIKLND